MVELERLVARSVEEAISMLSEHGQRAKIIAGGTDLLVHMKKGSRLPDVFISIGGIRGLDYIKHDKDGLKIGALTTLRSIQNSSLIESHFGILSRAAATLGTPAIRNQATIGGNLCNAAPSADTAPALIVLGARAKIEGLEGELTLPIEDFFKGPGQTALKHNQILTEIQIPNPPPTSRGVYLKQTRSKGADLAIVGIAVLVEMDGGIVKDARIALGAVAPSPIRAKKAEEILVGKKLDEDLLEESGQAASLESSPIDDVRGSADYRRKLVAVLVKRAVRQATEQISSEI